MIGSRGSILAWAGERSCSIIAAFRSNFRDRANERTSPPHAVMESALAHVVRNEAEAAYSRSDHPEKRRVLMERWDPHRTAAPAAVVAIR